MNRTLDAAQKERDLLARNYRAEKAKQMMVLFADPIHGDKLRKFVATLGHFGPDHAERMIEYVRAQYTLWIAYAAENIHAAALEAIGERIARIREKAGLVPFDDALPDEPDDVWRICKKVLAQ